MHNEASPEHEAVAYFNKISSQKASIKRSGMKAMVLLQDSINGKTDSYGTSLVQEALTLRVLHNNPDRGVCFSAEIPADANAIGWRYGLHAGS